MTDFGGNVSAVTADPTNPLNNVSTTTKTVAAQTWAGTTIGTGLGFATPVPFAVGSTSVSVRVWSPDAGIPVRLKVEDHTNNTITCETQVNTTVAAAWDTLVFNFSNQATGTAPINLSNTYDLMSIFFNFGTDGATAGAKTYYFDDVYFGSPVNPLAQIDLPITFEDTLVDYTMTDFGGNASAVIVDPTNPLNMVAEATKTAGAQSWAGTTCSTPSGLANAIPFSMTATTISVRVWSPDAGIQIRLKAEDHTNNTITVETEKTTTVANGWEILVFDFSNPVPATSPLNLANTYDLLSIFFNFGVDGATAGAKTYYFDDVQFGTIIGNDVPGLADLRYFPNPTTGSLRIEAAEAMQSVLVHDIMGKAVLQKALDTPQAQLDLQELGVGVYMVTVRSANAVSHFRIIKE
jgi:Secretion system C-terminal sorting domain